MQGRGEYHDLLALSRRELAQLVLQKNSTIKGLKTVGDKLRQHIKELEGILQNVGNT